MHFNNSVPLHVPDLQKVIVIWKIRGVLILTPDSFMLFISLKSPLRGESREILKTIFHLSKLPPGIGFEFFVLLPAGFRIISRNFYQTIKLEDGIIIRFMTAIKYAFNPE